MKVFSLIVFIFLIASSYAGWSDRKAEGWAWYEDKSEEADKEPIEISIEPVQQTASEQLAHVRKELEEKLSRAILEPTKNNVTEYMTMQKLWVNQSEKFAKTWAHVLLNQPELDEIAQGFPVSQYGIQYQKQFLQEKTESLIRELTKKCGLLFFYEGSNKSSVLFSLVVKSLIDRYGWNVISVSMDGILIDGLPNNKIDNGISEKFGVDIFPSLFVVNPQTDQAMPISFGLSSIDQIESNILMQFSRETSE